MRWNAPSGDVPVPRDGIGSEHPLLIPTARRTEGIVSEKNRARIAYKVRYAATHPTKVPGYVRRLCRDQIIRLKAKDHVSYYRAVMRSDTDKNPRGAVGTPTEERWLTLGKMQFDYLKEHGLKPEHRMLEIGCGNLRAGWRFIDYLEPHNYYGIDISPDILLSAQQTIADYQVADKFPHMTLVNNLKFTFLPDGFFDVVHAHSVFSHSPLNIIDECFAHVGRIMAPDGLFDFTFDRTEGEEHHVLREDFYYRTETLINLAEKHGLKARFMDDWEKLPHGQSKIRVTRS
ncbi:MAG: methyltransferase [Streptosporangiales bacterium]|nr:methyltransferase [Streptosporangiales bacterium]